MSTAAPTPPVPSPIRIGAQVAEALSARAPVLALESTIFTHGLPRPRNIEVALEAEDVFARSVSLRRRSASSTEPDGRSVDGRDRALSNADAVVKASLRDLPVAAAKGLSAGTTVAATAISRTAPDPGLLDRRSRRSASRRAADLRRVGRPGTLACPPDRRGERGREVDPRHPPHARASRDAEPRRRRLSDDRYPGFYIADSGYPSNAASTPPQTSPRCCTQRALGMPSDVLVANPVPEAEQLDPTELDGVIDAAWPAAERTASAVRPRRPSCSTTSGERPGPQPRRQRGSSPQNIRLAGQAAMALVEAAAASRGARARCHRRRRPGRRRLAAPAAAQGHGHEARDLHAPGWLGGRRRRRSLCRGPDRFIGRAATTLAGRSAPGARGTWGRCAAAGRQDSGHGHDPLLIDQHGEARCSGP